jgi:hypothetical protein
LNWNRDISWWSPSNLPNSYLLNVRIQITDPFSGISQCSLLRTRSK